jgi:hypothetical protein
MTDAAYKKFLTLLATQHVRVSVVQDEHESEELQATMDRLSWISQLLQLVRKAPDGKNVDNYPLLARLVGELAAAPITAPFSIMKRTGVMDALDEAPDAIFANLRRSAIPDEDTEFLARAGVLHPELEITILIEYSRKHLTNTKANSSEIAEEAKQRFFETVKHLHQEMRPGSSGDLIGRKDPKKRKLFNGLGKILAGAVTGAGNVLLACGTIVAPNPATAYGLIASSALAIGSVCQGIGDLRGE